MTLVPAFTAPHGASTALPSHQTHGHFALTLPYFPPSSTWKKETTFGDEAVLPWLR